MQQEMHCHPPIWEGSMFVNKGFSKPLNLGSLCIVGFFPYQGLPGLHLIKTRKIFLKQLWDCHGESVGSRGPPFSGSIFGFGGVIKVHRENGGTLNMGARIYLHLISWAFIRYPLLKGSLRGLNSLGTTQGYQHFPYEKWFMILSSSHCMIVQGMTLRNEKAPKMNVTMEKFLPFEAFEDVYIFYEKPWWFSSQPC